MRRRTLSILIGLIPCAVGLLERASLAQDVPDVSKAKVTPGSNLGAACGWFFPNHVRDDGSVELLIFVTESGRVTDTRVVKSSGIPRIDEATIRCLKSDGRFEPMMVDGDVVGAWQHMKWTWRLVRDFPPEVETQVHQPVAEAIRMHQFARALPLAKAELAAAKTLAGEELALRELLDIALHEGDLSLYAGYAARLVEVADGLTGAERTALLAAIARIHAQERLDETARLWAIRWADASQDPEACALVARILLAQSNDADAIPWLEKAAGALPREQTLRRLQEAYARLGRVQQQRSTLETLLEKYLKREYVVALASLEAGVAEPRARLELLRLLWDADALTHADDYLRYAEDALVAGSPTESILVLRRVEERQLLADAVAGARGASLAARAQAEEARQQKALAILRRTARLRGRGDADVALGLAYLGAGDGSKAAEAIERGLQADRVGRVPSVADACLVAGIANLRVGREERALEYLSKARADDRISRAAALWIAWAKVLRDEASDGPVDSAGSPREPERGPRFNR